MVLLLRHTGLRISDTCTLAKSRIQNDRIVLYTQKTGGHVLLPIPRELDLALQALPLPRGCDCDRGYFFWNGRTSKRAALGIAERTLAAVFRKAKVPRAHAHRFRHTLATEILAKGGTITDVTDVLGIGDHVARKHSAKWSQARQERIFALMERVQSATFLLQTEKEAVIN